MNDTTKIEILPPLLPHFSSFPISTKGQKFNHHHCYCYNNICMGNSHSYWPPNSWAACGHFALPKNRGVSQRSYPLIPAGWESENNRHLFFNLFDLKSVFLIVFILMSNVNVNVSVMTAVKVSLEVNASFFFTVWL